jgi:hypothetical protein
MLPGRSALRSIMAPSPAILKSGTPHRTQTEGDKRHGNKSKAIGKILTERYSMVAPAYDVGMFCHMFNPRRVVIVAPSGEARANIKGVHLSCRCIDIIYGWCLYGENLIAITRFLNFGGACAPTSY